MQGYNLMMVYSRAGDRILLCRRRKDPYRGLYNFVGGKIEPGEDGPHAAYRELFEETGITARDIRLVHMMDLTYYLDDCYIEVYAGRLSSDAEPRGDENPLCWSALDRDFFDMSVCAGHGNMGHMLELARLYGDRLFGPEPRP